MTSYGVVLFHTTSAVMRAEKLLVKEGFSVKLIPTPRQFSSDCGIALRFDFDSSDRVKTIFSQGQIEFAAFHSLVE